MANFYIVELLPEVTVIAIGLLTQHGLRGPDAIQLASCLFFKKHIQQEIEFVVFDLQLMDVAHRKGLQVWKKA